MLGVGRYRHDPRMDTRRRLFFLILCISFVHNPYLLLPNTIYKPLTHLPNGAYREQGSREAENEPTIQVVETCDADSSPVRRF